MAATPRFKIYSADGEYIAATKYPEEAAAVVALRGIAGTTIRSSHAAKHAVWTEGTDGVAGESFDIVAETISARLEARATGRPAPTAPARRLTQADASALADRINADRTNDGFYDAHGLNEDAEGWYVCVNDTRATRHNRFGRELNIRSWTEWTDAVAKR